MSIPNDLRYTKEHEWVRHEDGVFTVGITHHAQDQLGDVVFLELPDVGTAFSAGDAFGVVESVKAVSDLYAPLSGEVVEVNEALVEQPETINAEPYTSWLLKFKSDADFAKLLSADAYEGLLKAEA